MSLLGYCATSARSGSPANPPIGVGGADVILVTSGELSLAASAISEDASVVGVEQLVTYERVIESLHRYGSVVPLRWGSLFADQAAILAHLDHSRERYRLLLAELDGYVELGIRVMAEPNERACERAEVAPRSAEPSGPGAAYLASRRTDLQRRDGGSGSNPALVARWTRPFRGLYRRCFEEVGGPGSPSQTPMHSLYFLVAREDVTRFRSKFRELAAKDAKALLTGPWPPYNFVGSRGRGSGESAP